MFYTAFYTNCDKIYARMHPRRMLVAKATQKFFDELTDQSEAKARIIEKYFSTWANVVIPSAKMRDNTIAYMDLYAGPGRYKDGSASTPLLVLEKALEHK